MQARQMDPTPTVEKIIDYIAYRFTSKVKLATVLNELNGIKHYAASQTLFI